MNARVFRRNVILVMCIYLILVVIGAVIRVVVSSPESLVYGAFKDLLPLAIAIPAAWLGYCFQRRQAYLKDVRDLWSKLVIAAQEAIQYTHLQNPPQSEFAKVQKNLSIVIEEVLGVFLNLGQAENTIGLFPFEGTKNIQKVISALGFGGVATPSNCLEARAQIIQDWKKLRTHFLSECARGEPIKPDSPYLR